MANVDFKKKYLYLLGPVLASAVGWWLSGDWKLGLTLFSAAVIGNSIAYYYAKGEN
jgi:hypothetical protein